jgi:hypothetical protein
MSRVERALFLAAFLVSCGSPTPDDVRFQELADRAATRTGRHVVGWGTAPLADDTRPRRFAVLEPDDLTHGRGAYLIEDTRTALWLVTFAIDGRTRLWAVDRADDSWQPRLDAAVDHGQTHPHGSEEITFALRGGDLVVLTHDYLGEGETEVIERQRFATDGVCTEPCPTLRSLSTEDFDFEVVGPVRTLGALIKAERGRERSGASPARPRPHTAP